MLMKPTNYDVAIVGCGPVGATLANLLRLYGHSVAIIEKHKEVFYCPRAGGVDEESLRILDTIGVLDELYANDDLYEADLIMCDANERPISVFNRASMGEEARSGHAGYPTISMIYQPNLEKSLRAAYEDSPLVDSFMGFEVLSIEDLGQVTKIKYKNREDDSEGELSANYIVGCDGANSLVANYMDGGETNFNYTEAYLIIDAYINDPDYLKARFAEGAKMIFDPVYAGVVGKGLHGHIRLDFRIHEDSETGRNLNTQDEFQKAAERLIKARNLDIEKFDIVRLVKYVFKARTPENWRTGRLLLAGDAAHLTPPWAGQGLNMGMRDTANIAFKLNLVLNNQAGESLLDTYTQERRPSSLITIGGAVKTGKLMETTNPFVVGLRNFGMWLIGKSEIVAGAMAKQWQNKPPYKAGFIDSSNKLAGTWMIQPRVRTKSGEVMRLDKLIGTKFALISTDSSTGENVYRFIKELGGIVLKQDYDFHDHDGQFMAWCKANKVKTILMRPDRYIFDAGNDGDALCASLFKVLDNYSD